MYKSNQIILCLFSILLLIGTAHAQQKKVMVINSYHTDYPWVAAHNAALKDVLEGKVDLSFFNMDTKRFPLDKHEERASLAMAAFEKEQPDLVVLTDDNALKALGNQITLSGTPIVYLGINNDPREYLGNMILATGVLERPLLKPSIVYLRDILKEELHKCLILFDNGTTAHAILNLMFHGQKSLTFSGTVANIRLLDGFDDWKKTVLNAKKQGYDVIILGLYHTLTDKKGTSVDAEEAVRWASRHSPVPLFGFWDFSVGKGKAIGGLVLDGGPQGEEAAQLVLRILSGENPHAIQPITAEQGRLMFSRSELERWDLKLPAYFHNPPESVILVE